MTDAPRTVASAEDGPRQAQFRTTHAEAGAETVAAAVRPDNAPSMTTRVDADAEAVVTTIERARTGGLAASVDDYVVNVTVADRVARSALEGATDTERRGADGPDGPTADAREGFDEADPDADTVADTETDADERADTDTNANADTDTDTNANTDDTHQP
jgi:hypothetical protein